MNFLNVDLHCDLLSYFLYPNTGKKEEIGCSLPYLIEGNVGLQVMAIYTSTEKGSVQRALQQAEFFEKLKDNPDVFHLKNFKNQHLIEEKVGIVPAIKNASGLCEEDEPLDNIVSNYEKITSITGKPTYISLTHHGENRFGGGNTTEIGLKDDGKILIDFLVDKKIPIDFSHTSEALAYDILNYCTQKNYSARVLASHSNSRFVFQHNRNLPDELVHEILRRDGIIGINFIKDFINPNNPLELYNHISHLLELGAENYLVYGGDFFFDAAHPDKSRYPFFFDEFKNALAYNKINDWISENYSESVMKKISHQNALRFFSETN